MPSTVRRCFAARWTMCGVLCSNRSRTAGAASRTRAAGARPKVARCMPVTTRVTSRRAWAGSKPGAGRPQPADPSACAVCAARRLAGGVSWKAFPTRMSSSSLECGEAGPTPRSPWAGSTPAAGPPESHRAPATARPTAPTGSDPPPTMSGLRDGVALVRATTGDLGLLNALVKAGLGPQGMSGTCTAGRRPGLRPPSLALAPIPASPPSSSRPPGAGCRVSGVEPEGRTAAFPGLNGIAA
jgi:hypothetical protein